MDRSLHCVRFRQSFPKWRNIVSLSHPIPSHPIPANGCNGKLTAREHQIAVLAAQGLQAKKIAHQLMISDKTVRNLLSIIYCKLNVSCQIELAMKARDLGLL